VKVDVKSAKLKNNVIKPKKRVAREAWLELSSDEEFRVQFSTIRNRKKNKSTNNGVIQSSNKTLNINKSQNHNQAKERLEQELNSGDAKAVARHLWKAIKLHVQHYHKIKRDSTN
jgi:hypothetical protein